jgi:hypothetical protein
LLTEFINIPTSSPEIKHQMRLRKEELDKKARDELILQAHRKVRRGRKGNQFFPRIAKMGRPNAALPIYTKEGLIPYQLKKVSSSSSFTWNVRL